LGAGGKHLNAETGWRREIQPTTRSKMNETENLSESNKTITLENEDRTARGLTPEVLFIEDVARVLRTSRQFRSRHARR
jgi:hypothetical protein